MQVLGNLHIELNKKSFIITKVKTLGDKEASEGSVHRWFSTVRFTRPWQGKDCLKTNFHFLKTSPFLRNI